MTPSAILKLLSLLIASGVCTKDAPVILPDRTEFHVVVCPMVLVPEKGGEEEPAEEAPKTTGKERKA